MAFLSAVLVPSLLAAAGISTVLRWTFDEFWPIAIVAAGLSVLALLFLMRVHEPRKENGASAAPTT